MKLTRMIPHSLPRINCSTVKGVSSRASHVCRSRSPVTGPGAADGDEQAKDVHGQAGLRQKALAGAGPVDGVESARAVAGHDHVEAGRPASRAVRFEVQDGTRSRDGGEHDDRGCRASAASGASRQPGPAPRRAVPSSAPAARRWARARPRHQRRLAGPPFPLELAGCTPAAAATPPGPGRPASARPRPAVPGRAAGPSAGQPPARPTRTPAPAEKPD